MFDTKAELLEKIRLGEDSLLEVKEVRTAGSRITGPDRHDLADELAAFANTRGGVCVLGVDDKSHEILGIPLHHLDEVETFVRNIVTDNIKPPLPVIIQKLTLPAAAGAEIPILKVDVPRSLFVHESPGGYFHRVGSSRRKMSPEYLFRLGQQRSQARIIRFDEQTLPKATLEDLDDPLWKRFRTERSSHDSREVFLTKLGMAARDEDGALRPTIAGILLATSEPRRHWSNAFIQAVAYRGHDLAASFQDSLYQLDAADLTGPLDRQIAGAFRFVMRNTKTFATKHTGRTDIPQYDATAVFEALVNAVAHRDYAIHGSKIRLRMFSDRLELYSPGALPNTMSVDSMAERQASRNETVTSLLARCPILPLTGLATERTTFMDRRGEGVPLILGRSEALSGRRPEYVLIDGEELKLTIFAANPLG